VASTARPRFPVLSRPCPVLTRLNRLWWIARGWTCIPAPVPVARPFYAIGTQARLDGIRALYAKRRPADASTESASWMPGYQGKG